MSTSRKVVVVGAGIGGLTAALALLERGIDVEVYEQSNELKEVGAGIQISSNGTRVLFALGLEAALARVQVRPERRELRHWSTGETWNWFDLGDKNVQRFGTPHLMLHRADLHDLLAGAVRAKKRDIIKLNKKCLVVASQAGHADATFADGGTVRAAYVIGADGIHSTIRVCLFGPSKPIFTGCIAWRGLIPMQKLPSRLARMVGTNWLGPHGNVLHYPVRRGEIMNFVSTSEREDWRIESWSTVGTRDELRHDFRDWHPDVQVMIDQIETPYKWALMIREPMPAWSKGRVTLLGDACHPTLPFLGQGGVMAIEDGYVLAACLDKYLAAPDLALARYEAIRRERTAMVVRKASENKASAFAPALADKERVAEEVAREWQQVRLRERMEWLYNYDATAIAV
ncbi:MAG TPA: FAD-dependent monooxygenase [Xanthobacteraceae bacterium]|nr:FAD-dependent monooxygenase [Xanthobacteraceae bacterium]